jgi:hypothetical protein
VLRRQRRDHRFFRTTQPKETTMPTTERKDTSKTSTPHKTPVPDGKSELPTTLPDFPGPVTTPPPAQATE